MPVEMQSGRAGQSSRMVQELETAFQRSGYGALRRIGIEEQPNVLKLRGTVKSYYLKQVAQTVAMQVIGSYGLQNELEVC